MNTIQETKEETEHRVPLIPHAVNGHQNIEDIPYADDVAPAVEQLFSVERKVSLGEQRNLDLSITIRVDEKQTPQSSNEKLDEVDTSGIVIKVENVSRNLRRNSISMPSGINALDLEAMRMKHQQMQEQEPLSEEDNNTSDSHRGSIVDDEGSISFSVPEKSPATTIRYENENDDSDDELGISGRKPVHRDLFRNRRRASIAPLPALRLNSREMLASDYDTHSLASNQASITSINSLASLLREKMQAFPQMIRKKKRETKDYKIKIFVTIMFFIIIFLIGYAYVGYNRLLLTKSVFEKIKFNAETRIFQIFSHDEKRIISGQLGVTVNSDLNPFHCLEDNRKTDGSVCMEWNGIARLYMNFNDMDVFRCYSLKWQALSPGFFPTDCYELKPDSGLWFGGSITKGMDWSLNTANFDFAPFESGDTTIHQFGNAVKRYFINSIGVAIQVTEKTPLHISVNQTKNQLCLRAMNDEFSFVNRLTPLPELDYKICTTEGIRSLHMLMTQKSLWDGLTETDIKTLHSLIEEPVWKVPFESEVESMNETTIYTYSEAVISMGLGHILVNEFWQENIGDFTVDRLRFPTLKDTIDALRRRGFKIVFTIQPFISTDSPSFKDAVKNKLLIYERYSDRSIPALTRYKSSVSAGVLDITNNASVPWLMKKLNALKKEYQVDSFYLDLGTGYNLPHYYQCNKTLENPDNYASMFTQKMQEAGFIGVSTASVVPKPPAFLSLPPTNSSWRGLREVLSTVLNYGVLGYPFVLPGAIGGDFSLRRKISKMVSFYSLGQPELPEPELYIRWLQLVTFFPSMQFGHLPAEYKLDYINDIAKELTNVRQKYVIPMLKKYLSESMNEGLPLVRPLWMLDPQDPFCLNISDEFSVGEELIVAPILEKTIDEREVYLPQGVWKDGIDGALRKGNRWIHSYKVPKDKIAYFIKMPDNTRF